MRFNSAFKGLMKILSIRSNVVPCERTDGQTEKRDRQKQVIVAFRNFVEAP